MTEKDQQRWNSKWESRSALKFDPHPLLTKNRDLITGNGAALDLACGLGQNAIWLAQLGYRVLGVDISRVALERARVEARSSGIEGDIAFKQVDLDIWLPAEDTYDLICVIRFLDRDLLPAIRKATRAGGVVVYATRHLGALKKQPKANKAYLLEANELAGFFSGWQFLHYLEGADEAELIARKPDLDNLAPATRE
jgi:SAM-dependent methyltransferase